MGLAGAWVKDVNLLEGAGPVDPATGAGKAFRARNISGDFADIGVILYAADGTVLLGQKTMAASIPVVLASDQAAIPVSSMTPGVAATNLGKAEDAAHANGDVGVMALAVRNDAFAVLTGDDLDYSPIAVDSRGRLHVGKVTPGESGADLGKAEDAVHASGDTGVFAFGTRQDTPVATSGTAGDYQGAAYGPTGRQYADAAPAGDVIMWNGVACPVKRAVIAAAGSGNNTLVAAVASKYLVVVGYEMISAGVVNAKFQSGAGGTDITGLAYLIANTGKVVAWCPGGCFTTQATNTLLNLNLSAAIAVGGWILYIETLSI